MNQICIVCRKRAAIMLQHKACRKCALLTAAENTRQQWGLPLARKDTAARRALFIRTWNKMMKEGKTVADVAKTLGCSRQTVKNTAVDLRAEGVELEQSRVKELTRQQPQDPIDRDDLASHRVNEHGGGKWGITKCKCALCLEKRRASSRAWSAANGDKKRVYRRTYADKQKQKDTPP